MWDGMAATASPASFDKRGRDGKVIDWLDELTTECPKRLARKLNDPCGARPGFGEDAVAVAA